MKKAVWTIVILALLVASATAQDSVSKTGGLPGDAVSPYDPTEQINDYIVDLTPFRTSKGTKFGIAPLVKSSKASPSFFSSLISAQGISRTASRKIPFARNSYMLWRGQGFGVNNDPTINDPGTVVSTTGLVGNQFATLFAEFSGPTESIIGAVVNQLPDRLSRLYVSRVVAAINGTSSAEDTASFAGGSVDSRGSVHFRADGFGATGPNPLTDNNLFRVDLTGRSAIVVNRIDNAGPADAAATDWLLVRSTTTHNTPSILGRDRTPLDRPVLLGSNFATEMVFEGAPNVLSTTTAHRLPSTDHRGNVAFFDVGSVGALGLAQRVGTAAMYGKDDADLTRRTLLWGVLPNGDVSGTFQFDQPLTITDNADGFVFPPGGSIDEFILNQSQTAFRGGNGQVAVGRDQAGRILVANHVVGGALGGNNPINAISVARFSPQDPSGTLEFTLAAYNDFPNGKPICDAQGNAVGQVVELNQVTGGDPFGPSMSAPCIDSVGNVWILASVELFDRLPGGESDFDNALLRAVYDPATFSYQLELVLELGSVFRGQNSTTDWQVRFLTIADSNSISSGSMFSGNILRAAANGINTTGLSPGDPQTLGGLVIQASIVYDVNADGEFVTDPPSPDEQYNALLYVGALSDGSARRPLR